MDRGYWKLICQRCGEVFEIEVKPGERVIIFAKEAACPSCHTKPDVDSAWHHVVGFRNLRNE
jgi:hypothetical protein